MQSGAGGPLVCRRSATRSERSARTRAHPLCTVAAELRAVRGSRRPPPSPLPIPHSLRARGPSSPRAWLQLALTTRSLPRGPTGVCLGTSSKASRMRFLDSLEVPKTDGMTGTTAGDWGLPLSPHPSLSSTCRFRASHNMRSCSGQKLAYIAHAPPQRAGRAIGVRDSTAMDPAAPIRRRSQPRQLLPPLSRSSTAVQKLSACCPQALRPWTMQASMHAASQASSSSHDLAAGVRVWAWAWWVARIGMLAAGARWAQGGAGAVDSAHTARALLSTYWL